MALIPITPVAWVYDNAYDGQPSGVIHAVFERALPDGDPDPASYVAPEQYRVVLTILKPPVKIATNRVREYSEGLDPNTPAQPPA
ncbi:hypothetical protein M2302_002226 [Micromonospora sp. A200]|uniref:hypothetical protein n=1 Tax=Micromonospora sp. A200 TaxID=2940568 RepID=UPI00247319EA|nr:hypothetical protein [Micromonospora sp. A200]MDH6462051.1 hypothetical protein [Micromonospora sp. A200]